MFQRRFWRAMPFALPLLLVSCTSPAGQPTPGPTPLPLAVLQRLYAQAADNFDRAEGPIEQQEYLRCPGGSGPQSLSVCESALSRDRQTTLAFDSTLRSLVFPASAVAVVDKLLSDDSSLEQLQEQAATAPSLSAISSLTAQIFALYALTTSDAAAVRSALGLPVSSSSASPTPID